MKLDKNSKRNVAIRQIDYMDLTYYFRETQNLSYNEAKEKAYKIADFMLTKFDCSYRREISKRNLNFALRKYGEENLIK